MRKVLAIATLAAAMSFGLPCYAQTHTLQVCVGDVAPGQCWSEDNYNCDFANAHKYDTDAAAGRAACAKKGMRVFDVSRLDVHHGGTCGYITLSVTCEKR